MVFLAAGLKLSDHQDYIRVFVVGLLEMVVDGDDVGDLPDIVVAQGGGE